MRSERTREEIFIRINGDNMSTFECIFTNSQRPVVDCLTVAAGISSSASEVIKGTGADQRFGVSFQKCWSVTMIYSYKYSSQFFLPSCTLPTNQNFAVEIQL